jgi:hypothetical protein
MNICRGGGEGRACLSRVRQRLWNYYRLSFFCHSRGSDIGIGIGAKNSASTHGACLLGWKECWEFLAWVVKFIREVFILKQLQYEEVGEGTKFCSRDVNPRGAKLVRELGVSLE